MAGSELERLERLPGIIPPAEQLEILRIRWGSSIVKRRGSLYTINGKWVMELTPRDGENFVYLVRMFERNGWTR